MHVLALGTEDCHVPPMQSDARKDIKRRGTAMLSLECRAFKIGRFYKLSVGLCSWPSLTSPKCTVWVRLHRSDERIFAACDLLWFAGSSCKAAGKRSPATITTLFRRLNSYILRPLAVTDGHSVSSMTGIRSMFDGTAGLEHSGATPALCHELPAKSQRVEVHLAWAVCLAAISVQLSWTGSMSPEQRL